MSHERKTVIIDRVTRAKHSAVRARSFVTAREHISRPRGTLRGQSCVTALDSDARDRTTAFGDFRAR